MKIALRIACVTVALITGAAPMSAQRRSPLDRMTPWERKKLESFEDRDDPYRPAWMARTRFSTIATLRRSFPFPSKTLEITAPELAKLGKEFTVVDAPGHGTVFLYDRALGRLAALAEYERRGRTTALRRWVRYHPSFTEFVVTDLTPGDNGEPEHHASRLFLRTLWHANARGRITAGTGAFRIDATNKRAAWFRDGLLAQTQRLLDVPRGPTHDDHDRVPAGEHPYRPAWAEEQPFKELARRDGRLPREQRRIAGTTIDEEFEVRSVPEKRTWLAYSRKSGGLSYLLEARRREDGSARCRLVTYHPSFSAYTVYDMTLDGRRRTTHRMTTRYERERFSASPKNRRKVEGEGKFIRKWQFAGGAADFGAAPWELLRIAFDGR